jgi:hypothetical protein
LGDTARATRATILIDHAGAGIQPADALFSKPASGVTRLAEVGGEKPTARATEKKH